MSHFQISHLYVRDNPRVKQTEHKANMFSNDHFYPKALYLGENSCVISSTGQVLFRVLSGIVPQSYLTLLNNFTTKYSQQGHVTNDIRGPHTTMKFGSYLERGGSGKIFTVKGDKQMLESIDEVGKFVSEVFSKVCEEVAINVRQVPQQYKLWDAITLMF